MKRKMIECDNCKYKMTEKEYEAFPECPMCGGHYVTVVKT
jgi:Zn finger protein HypA/HybF involved in hydrogenase expression